jgi:hypothetical protein
MYICEKCYEECNLIPVEVSLEDEPLDLELYSDCCIDSYLITDEAEIEAVDTAIENLEELTEREITIGRYLGHEV